MIFEDQIRGMPFVRLVVPLILGIQCGMRLHVFFSVVIPIVLFLFVLMTYVLLKHYDSYSKRFVFSIPLFFFLVSAGWFLTVDRLSMTQHINLPEDRLIIASILNDPKETEKSISIQIEIEACRWKMDWFETEGNAVVYLQKDSLAKRLEPGMLISFMPAFDSIRNSGNPKEFDYANYMAYHMIASQTYLKSGTWKVLGYTQQNSLRQSFLGIRNRLLTIYKDVGLTGDEYAVAAALSLGYKDKLQDELKHAYSSSGAMHVLAVSGLHVGIIFVVMQFLLSLADRLKKFEYLKVIILIGCIWFYALLTGLSPSVFRAAIMFSFISAGKLFKRNINTYNILAASAFVTLIINPLSLASLGFWLSYLAVLSIVMFYEPVYSAFKSKYLIINKLWSLVAVSIAAQIGTFPLTIYYFHQFSNYFLLTNVIVIPLVSVIVYMAMGVFVFSFFPFVGELLGKLFGWMIGFLNDSVFFIESLPFSVSENLYISKLQLVILYIIIVLFAVLLIKGKRRVIFPALICGILFFSIGLYRDYKTNFNKNFIVYNLRSDSGINFIIGDEHVLFTDFKSDNYEKNAKILNPFWLSEGVSKEKYVDLNKMNSQYLFTNILSIDNPELFLKNGFIGFEDKRILIIRDDRFRNVSTKEKLVLNYIVISGNPKVSASQIKALFDCDLIIFDSSNSYYYREKLKADLIKCEMNVFDVAKQGAFIDKLSES